MSKKQIDILTRLITGEFNVDYPKPTQPLSDREARLLDAGITGATSTFMGLEQVSPVALFPAKEDKDEIELGFMATWNPDVVEAANAWLAHMVKERGLLVMCAELWRVTINNKAASGEAVGVRLMTEKFQVLYHNEIAMKDGHRYLTKWVMAVDTRMGGRSEGINIRDSIGADEAN